jgi:hypothetical protein
MTRKRKRSTLDTPAARFARKKGTRSAYASMVALLISGVLLMFVVVLGRYTVDAFAAEQAAVLDTQADQILLSARDWSRVNAGSLRRGGEVELPLDGLIPQGATGRLTLRYVATDAKPALVECNLQIRQSRRSAGRRVYWPADMTRN